MNQIDQKENGMKLIKTGLLTVLFGGAMCHAGVASAYDFYAYCEQGAPNSWKACEAATDYPGRKTFQWYGNTGALLAANCSNGRQFCSAYCRPGAGAGTAVFVNILNSSGQLVGTASDTLGCHGS
jgi:hypothetical protein